MKESKEYTEGIAINENKFVLWLDNYWYHYKWVTIVVAFFLIIAIICIAQSCSKVPSDVKLTYAGPAYLSGDKKLAIESAVSGEMPEGFSKNGKAEIDLLSYYILSKEQIEDIQKETDSEGRPKEYVDTYFITSEQETFESQLMTGSSSVLLLDPSIFDSLGGNAASERLRPLNEIFDNVPDKNVNGFGIRLGDTEAYRSNPELQVLPADTILCLHEKLLSQKQSVYDKDVEAFKALATLADDGE